MSNHKRLKSGKRARKRGGRWLKRKTKCAWCQNRRASTEHHCLPRSMRRPEFLGNSKTWQNKDEKKLLCEDCHHRLHKLVSNEEMVTMTFQEQIRTAKKRTQSTEEASW